jgi:hypothetical protein
VRNVGVRQQRPDLSGYLEHWCVFISVHLPPQLSYFRLRTLHLFRNRDIKHDYKVALNRHGHILPPRLLGHHTLLNFYLRPSPSGFTNCLSLLLPALFCMSRMYPQAALFIVQRVHSTRLPRPIERGVVAVLLRDLKQRERRISVIRALL